MNNSSTWTIIQEEHQVIREKLSLIATEKDLWPLVDWLWEHVEEQHHLQEETLLFDTLQKFPRLREGGPRCIYFYGMQMSDPPLVLAERVTNKKADWLPHQQSFLAENSPLMIPITEHRATRLILEHIRQLRESIEMETVRNLLAIYANIQTTNMEKEETCLRHLSDSILSYQENSRISGLWKKWSVP
jgi:hemerythrin-like domain-containing protein